MGFRYRSSSNSETLKSKLGGTDTSFYLALSYIKLFRSQPEPEIVYVSDARIPPVVKDGQVSHDLRQLNFDDEDDLSNGPAGVQLLDEKTMKKATADKMSRSPEEIYYKFRGEEILKNSGLR